MVDFLYLNYLKHMIIVGYIAGPFFYNSNIAYYYTSNLFDEIKTSLFKQNYDNIVLLFKTMCLYF